MAGFTDWLSQHMLTCLYKAISGMDCPGCGLQRSFIEMLRGQFGASLHTYPALLPVIFTLMLTALHLIFSFRNGAAAIKYSFIVTISIITISYVVKLTTQ